MPVDREAISERTPPGVGALWIIATLMVLAALHLGRDVFIPMALALLLCVVLVPPARMLQRWGLPRGLAVASMILLALGVIAGVALLVISQALSLAAELPNYEANLRERLRLLSDGSGALDRAAGTLRRLTEELSPAAPGASVGAVPVAPVSSGTGTLAAALNLFGVVTAPLASLAIALLLMAYLLMQREDVRDRFLRLAGMRDLHRTTRAMADATERVGRYLLMQVLLNATYGTAIGIGLTVIGIPNAPLWGVLAFLLRFIPFLGSWMSLSLTLFVAFATGTGWAPPLLVLALFLCTGFVVSQVLEPLLYGRSTGLSPLALLISSALWTVLWGPLGLLLAPPITACLAILGRHIPALSFFDVLLGNSEALPAPLRFYQRFLARDEEGALDVAEVYAAAHTPAAAIRDLVLPAAAALAVDRAAGVMQAGDANRIADGLATLAARLVAEEPLDADARRATVIGVAGAADRALGATTVAALRPRGWDGAATEGAEVAIVCLSRPVSPARLRRALAEAERAAPQRIILAPDDAAVAQAVAEARQVALARGLDQLLGKIAAIPATPSRIIEPPVPLPGDPPPAVVAEYRPA